jgi:arginyl-tRNA synthetase
MVSFDELLSEVGKDASRFFFLLRSSNSTLDFDIELAKSRNTDNPVYYVQYAHARLCSIEKMLQQGGHVVKDLGLAELSLLKEKEELGLLKLLEQFPTLIEESAAKREPHRLTYFAQEVAAALHFYYNKHRILTEDAELTSARVWLVRGVKQVLRNLCFLLGVSAPVSM